MLNNVVERDSDEHSADNLSILILRGTALFKTLWVELAEITLWGLGLCIRLKLFIKFTIFYFLLVIVRLVLFSVLL